MEKKIIIAPSVLSADFSDIRGALNQIKNSNCPWVHLDVMDGSFVPNLTFGPKFISDIRKHSDLFFDAHLMIEKPWNYAEEFAKAGCDCITFHFEACDDVKRMIDLIKSFNCKVGISVKPETPIEAVYPYLNELDLVLVMTVNPGFGGQSFMKDMLKKVECLKSIRNERKYLISADGGLNLNTIETAKNSGIDVAVAGSAFFNSDDKTLFVQKMINS